MHFHVQTLFPALLATALLTASSHSNPIPQTSSKFTHINPSDLKYERFANSTWNGTSNLAYDTPSYTTESPHHNMVTRAISNILPRCFPGTCPSKKPKPPLYLHPADKFAHLRLWFCDRSYYLENGNPVCGGTCHVWDRLSPSIIRAPKTNCIKTYPALEVPFIACDRQYGWQWASCTDHKQLISLFDNGGNSIYDAKNTGDIRILTPPGGEWKETLKYGSQVSD